MEYVKSPWTVYENIQLGCESSTICFYETTVEVEVEFNFDLNSELMRFSLSLVLSSLLVIVASVFLMPSPVNRCNMWGWPKPASSKMHFFGKKTGGIVIQEMASKGCKNNVKCQPLLPRKTIAYPLQKMMVGSILPSCNKHG